VGETGAELQLNRRLGTGTSSRSALSIERFRQGNALRQSRLSMTGKVTGYVQAILPLTNLHFTACYDQYGDFDPAFNPRLVCFTLPQKAKIKAWMNCVCAPNFRARSAGSRTSWKITSYELVCMSRKSDRTCTSLRIFANQMRI
jgi:hypothetical protein